MKLLKRMTFVLAAIGFAAAAASSAHAQDFEEHSLESGGQTRWFSEYQPEAFERGNPLVILLHGGGSSMRRIFRPQSPLARWLDLADDHGFLLIAPNGVNRRTGDTAGNRQMWNDLRSPVETADDVKFIRDVRAWAIRERKVDRKRVYVTGSSNGGMMTYRLLIERPNLFAAGAAFIANLPQADVRRPARPTPIMMMNGTADPVMPWEGGRVGRTRTFVRSAEATRDFWIDANRADRSAVRRAMLEDGDPSDECRIRLEFYPARERGAPVAFYVMEGGGHRVPIIRPVPLGPGSQRGMGPPCRDANGADLAWEFMSRH